jgi:DNA-directed RNA polymerase specialized sigma24 family protein
MSTSELKFTAPNAVVMLNSIQTPPAGSPLSHNETDEARRRSATWTIDKAAFDDLLCWLDPDPETAGRKYELLRRKLITIFRCRGCDPADELADKTFDRVARKLAQIGKSYIGDPNSYFYGVAKKICQEYLRTVAIQRNPPIWNVEDNQEELFQQLDIALSKLNQADRELILKYYRGKGRSKIDHRKALAKQMGLHPETLRLRAFRIRAQLKRYIKTEN